MPAYQQMGHDSKNLLGNVDGFAGAILSPVNETEADLEIIVAEHRSEGFEFIFDPQLYFPRSNRGRLATWSYFPRDFDTADMSSIRWWHGVVDDVAAATERVGATAVCSPAIIVPRFSDDYYVQMRGYADRLATRAAGKLTVLQSVVAKLDELEDPSRPFELASIVSHTKADGIYLIILCDVRPRDELRNVERLKGAMRLIASLEQAGLPVTVACSSSDVVLWKAAGATSCASGKFANLRRFTAGRFNELEEGGRQVAYWFAEELLAFIRGSDIERVRRLGMPSCGTNPFANQILAQIADEPSKPWVAIGWRQYLYWFADIERRLTARESSSRDLVRTAEKNWQALEEHDIFMEERANDGSWLRPWLRAVVEFDK